MSSFIIKEIVKALKKQFGKDKKKDQGEKVEGETVPDSSHPHPSLTLLLPQEPSKPAVPEAPTVPPGWTAHLDVAANRYYYVETATGKTQWEPPAGTIMPPPKEVKKEEKKPDYMKMAKDYHKKSSSSAFSKNHLPFQNLSFPCHPISFFPYISSLHILCIHLFGHITNVLPLFYLRSREV